MAGESLHNRNTVSASTYDDNSGGSICVHPYPSVANRPFRVVDSREQNHNLLLLSDLAAQEREILIVSTINVDPVIRSNTLKSVKSLGAARDGVCVWILLFLVGWPEAFQHGIMLGVESLQLRVFGSGGSC